MNNAYIPTETWRALVANLLALKPYEASGKVEDFQVVELLDEAGVLPEHCRENEGEASPVLAVA